MKFKYYKSMHLIARENMETMGWEYWNFNRWTTLFPGPREAIYKGYGFKEINVKQLEFYMAII